jgi:hypothetical protein
MAFAKKTFQSTRAAAPVQLADLANVGDEDIPEDEDTEDTADELARLRAENASLKAQVNRPLRLKVAEQSGALSIYGLGRFPVTLYKEQWLRLLDMVAEIKAFIRANDRLLKSKNQK